MDLFPIKSIRYIMGEIMNCKNLRFRTKKVKNSFYKNIYYYCKIKRKEILKDDCYNCINKEYKEVKYKKKLCTFHVHKHKSTKATEIPMKVKKFVWERDGHACIYCGKYVDVCYANSHFIKRSQLGLGIEQNVVTSCPICHFKYDFKDFNGEMKNYTREYLSRLYDGWNEDDLVYRK